MPTFEQLSSAQVSYFIAWVILYGKIFLITNYGHVHDQNFY